MRSVATSHGEGAIEPLSSRHDRETFDCGEPALDRFLRTQARQNQDRGFSRTFVAVRGKDPRVLGYSTLTVRGLDAKQFPPEEAKRFPRYPVPVIHLARLAVDRAFQGQGLGEILLADVLERAVQVADVVGVFAVEVVAKTQEAKKFYEKHGFRAFPDDPLHLYLSIDTARALFRK